MNVNLTVVFLALSVACFVASHPVAEHHHHHLQDQQQQQLQGLPQQQLLNQQQESCHGLCESCGCRGYYCGDECICQCNWADENNVKCIQNMRARSQKMAYPFEVLIQGPAGRRFVREATDIDPETMATYKQNERSGRSVYSIYKPTANQFGKGGLMAAEGEADPSVGSASPTVGVAGPIKLAKLGGLLSLADQRKIARDRLASLTGKIGLLRSPNPEVGAAAPEDPSVGAAAADPTVGAAAPEEPVVGAAAPAEAAAEPIVAAAAPEDPTVGAAAPADPNVGSSRDPISPIWRNWPRINVTPPTWTRDFLKRLGNPIVASPHLIIQPDHTL